MSASSVASLVKTQEAEDHYLRLLVDFVTEPTKRENQWPTGEQDTTQNAQTTSLYAGHHGGPYWT